MRIKIEGRVTKERLKKAFETAIDHMGAEFQGFYNMNLYLIAYDMDGLVMKEFDFNGRPVEEFTIPAPEGEDARPAVTAKGRQRERGSKAAAAEETKLREQYLRQNAYPPKTERAIEYEKKMSARREQRLVALAEQAKREAQFKVLAAAFGPDIVRDVNEAIAAVWASHAPVHTSGKMRGQPRPLPSLEISKAGIFMHRDDSGKKFKQIGSPVSMVEEYPDRDGNYLKPHWAYPEWKDLVVPKIIAILATYQQHLAQLNNE